MAASSDDEVTEVKRRKIDRGKETTKEEGSRKRSPLRLTTVPESNDNADTVSLTDLLRHEDLVEMYQFSYLTDVSFAMECLHPKVRNKVKVHFVFDKKVEEIVKQDLEVAKDCGFGCENITLDPILVTQYGTHHTKMMVLVFPEHVQITVHTANLIPFDWANMTQGVFVSPPLPLGEGGGGENRFKTDFTQYLRAYKRSRLTSLAEFLTSRVDFSPIRNAVFIASVPGYYRRNSADYSQWGVVKLQKLVAEVDQGRKHDDGEIIIQMSSIGTMNALSTYFEPIMVKALRGEEIRGEDSDKNNSSALSPPKVRIIFPTTLDIERSYYGYSSGDSIHFNAEKQHKLLSQIGPMLCRWKAVKAGRDKAAPHIKTYMRTCKGGERVSWVLLTSANLSTPAWGIVAKKDKNQWIKSWEAGVFMYPESKEGFSPCYKTDISSNAEDEPLRLPFDLPLTGYTSDDQIWSRQTFEKGL